MNLTGLNFLVFVLLKMQTVKEALDFKPKADGLNLFKTEDELFIRARCIILLQKEVIRLTTLVAELQREGFEEQNDQDN